MFKLLKLKRLAKAWKKAYTDCWDNDPNGDDKEKWNKLEDLEHDMLDFIVRNY